MVWDYSCGAAQLYPSRSCGFTRCCARQRRHRERCQACRVQMAPSRVKMTSFLSLLFCIFRAASPAQTAFSPNDIKVNLTCVCCVQMAPSRVKMTSFLSLLFGIYWAASPAQTAFSPKNINGFSLDILPRVPRETPVRELRCTADHCAPPPRAAPRAADRRALPFASTRHALRPKGRMY